MLNIQSNDRKISVCFFHGLGDCAHFAHLIPLYLRRGYSIEVECAADKRILFEAAGASTVASGAATRHPWAYPSEKIHAGHARFWQGSKIGHNISESPLPWIGSKGDLWDEYSAGRIEIVSLLARSSLETAEKWLSNLPRPVVLLHTKGNTWQETKSLPDAVAVELYRALLDRFDGTILLLDWDNRVPRFASYRVRHLSEFGPCATETLLALCVKSDLLIGVDSGPLHAARFTDIPCVGIWMPGHYPATYTVPRPQQLNLVLSEPTKNWNRFKRIPWRIVENPGSAFDAKLIADLCGRMMKPTRYLAQTEIAADVQLQQFVSWCRGTQRNGFGSYSDRHRSFDHLLLEMVKRFNAPTVVETGTIRAEEDWSGAGFFTYWMAAFLYRFGGHLYSVDLNAQNCEFAGTWTGVFGEVVSIHNGNSVAYLEKFTDKIDVLFLDSLDTTQPGHAEHCQKEAEAAFPRLHEKSLVLVDDTPWSGRWTGKGEILIPWLLERGWRILYAGYQVLLAQGD